jgi:gamma-glutamylaminecyclotransferase
MSVLLFVYGTLKKGFSRHSALQDQRYLGTARTQPKYAIYHHGGYPAMVDEHLASQSEVLAQNSIYGELYEAGDETLVALDKIEGVDYNLFKRRTIDLDEISLLLLPISNATWEMVESKTAHSYLFQKNLKGCADCGNYWAKR